MKVMRKVRFKVIDPMGQVKIVDNIYSKDILKVATALKNGGYKIVKDSFQLSDTLVIGYTNIIRNCA